MRVSCLMKDTALKEALFDAIYYNGIVRAASGKSVSLSAIYNDLRKVGVEVDLETVGYIYNEVMPRDDARFDSETEIADYTTKTFRDQVNKMAAMEAIVGEKQITEQSAESAVATLIVRALYEDMVDDVRTTSDQKVLQDALWKGVRRKLGKLDGKKSERKSMEELITEALGWEKVGIRDVNGRLNSISDLFYAMKAEVAKASEVIRDAGDPATVERYDRYVAALEGAAYNLLFSRQEAKQVLYDTMKEAGFGKKLKSGSTVLDWNKLAGNIGSINDIRDNVETALSKAGFSPTVVERVKDSLVDEFNELKADIVAKQLANPDQFARQGEKDLLVEAGFNEVLGGRTMGEWIKESEIGTLEGLKERVQQGLADSKYIPEVKTKIAERFVKFFEENYPKVVSEEAQRYVKEVLGDQTALEWIKKNGVHNREELTEALSETIGNRSLSTEVITEIREAFQKILDIRQRAEKELGGREKRMSQPYAPNKSDIQRMVELYNLGVFNGSHNEILYRVIGVTSLQAQDLEDLEAFARAASDLSRKISLGKNKGGYGLGNDVFASREFQKIQRLIDGIINRNVSNKSYLLKVLSYAKGFIDVMLSSLLSMPRTLAQNIFSGAKSVITGMRFGKDRSVGAKERTKQEFAIWAAMLSDVTRTGQAYGEEIGSFATQELFTNSLKWKWNPSASPIDKAKSILYAATLPIRVGLLAFDSANKVSLTNKTFYNIIYNSLLKNYGSEIGAREATNFMNEMLYGQKFEDAKKLARTIAEETNEKLPARFRSKVTDAYVITLANDIVKANLSLNQIVTKEVLEAALKGSYHVAGLGLGHEPNNIFSRGIKGLRDNLKQTEQQLVSQKNWTTLGMHRIKSMVVNNFIIQFAGGATNWLWLRAKEGLGLGLYHMVVPGSAWSRDIDFANEKTLKKQIQDREKSRNDIARAFIGMTQTAVWYALGYGFFGSEDEDKMYKKIKGNTEADRWFRVLSPDAQLLAYYTANSKSGSVAEGVLRYAQRTYNGNDQFSVTRKMEDAIKLFGQGDSEGAWGKVASIVGDRISAPLWRPYKEYWRLASNPFKENPTPAKPYHAPTTWQEGLFGGGMLEDIGVYNQKARITMIPGVGIRSYERLKKLGIKSMEDVKKNPNWINLKDGDGFILDKVQRQQAQEFIDKYYKE
jgi:hypothetical protein